MRMITTPCPSAAVSIPAICRPSGNGSIRSLSDCCNRRARSWQARSGVIFSARAGRPAASSIPSTNQPPSALAKATRARASSLTARGLIASLPSFQSLPVSPRPERFRLKSIYCPSAARSWQSSLTSLKVRSLSDFDMRDASDKNSSPPLRPRRPNAKRTHSLILLPQILPESLFGYRVLPLLPPNRLKSLVSPMGIEPMTP
jgi:hypothetical protein